MDEAENIANAAAEGLCYSVLDHGREVLEEHLSKYNFASIEDAIAYYEKPAFLNLDHVPPGEIVKILMITEKPNISREVARILSKNAYYCDRDSEGDSRKSVYMFNYEVSGRRAKVSMISTYGHLTQQSYKRELKDGESEIALYAKIRDSPCGKSIPNHFFSKQAEGCHAVILWLDNDHEGEAISFEVIDYLFHQIQLPHGCHPMDAFFRARFSSPSEAVSAVAKLDRPNFLPYLGMIAKHHLDLRAGVSFSRCQKFVAKDSLGTYIWKLSFGPCSTVCVAIIVDYYLQMQKSPAKFCLEYIIDIDGEELFIRSRPMDEEEAKNRLESLQGFDHCEVLEGPKLLSSVPENAPPGLNTFELMRDQSEFFKRSSEVTAKLVQHLYEKGKITYPRSESTKYPADIKLHQHLLQSDKLGLSPDMHFDIQKAFEHGIDKGDHPPIMPTDSGLCHLDLKYWSDEQLEVYHYICRRSLASFMDDYEYSWQSVSFNMGGHKLHYEYFQHQKLGFIQLLPEYKAATPSCDLSAKLIPGAKFKFRVSLNQYPTPPLLKEHELIRKMEQYNVGTDGSLPSHISFIKNEGFVELNPETRELKPTPMGITLIEAYRNCIPEFVELQYRAKFIQGIEEIASGQKDFVTFYNETLHEYNDHYQKFKEFIGGYIESNKENFEKSVKEHNQKQMERDQAKAANQSHKKKKVVPEEKEVQN